MAFISNGTTILDAGAFQASLGSMVLLSEQTASSSASISFTSGIDSTYPIYKFEFINIHPQNNDTGLQFNMSTDGGSSYNVTKTTTSFRSRHAENDSYAVLEYRTGEDLAQSTGYQWLTAGQGNGSDEDGSGEFWLFNPSSTTFVKHFIAKSNMYYELDGTFNWFFAGYGNTTSAVNAIDFKMNSGNIDSGTIKLYGIKDS